MAEAPRFRILVVDESPAVSLFVDLAVGSEAVRVVGAPDGHAALDAVDHTRPDLVLAATGMNGLGGRTLAARLSERNLPVVLMSGSLDRSRHAGGVDAGVISKPLQVEQLRELVSRMMTDRPLLPAASELVARPVASRPVIAQPVAPFEPAEPAEAAMDPVVEIDPVDAWLREVDMVLGVAPKRWRQVAAADDDMHQFAHDVQTFRARPAAQGLQFSRRRTASSIS